jgi:hypothetical protein
VDGYTFRGQSLATDWPFRLRLALSIGISELGFSFAGR